MSNSFKKPQASVEDSGECDWISEFICKQDSAKEKLKAQRILDGLNRRDERLKKIMENSKTNLIEPNKKRIKHSHIPQVCVCRPTTLKYAWVHCLVTPHQLLHGIGFSINVL